MGNLGQRLRELEILDDQRKTRLATALLRPPATMEERRRAEVIEFFETAKRLTRESITAGRLPDEFKLHLESSEEQTASILAPQHADHGILVAFEEWAYAEGMNVWASEGTSGPAFRVSAFRA